MNWNRLEWEEDRKKQGELAKWLKENPRSHREKPLMVNKGDMQGYQTIKMHRLIYGYAFYKVRKERGNDQSN